MKTRPVTSKAYHATFLKTVATLYSKDRTTEWWTVRNVDKFYELRDAIPFRNLYCHDRAGGLVIYLDCPSIPEVQWRFR